MEHKLPISDSLFKKRLRKFKSLKRGYYSLIILTSLYLVSLMAPLLISNKALMIRYANGQFDKGESFVDSNGNNKWDKKETFNDDYEYFFPAFSDFFSIIVPDRFYEASFFGQDSVYGKKRFGEPHYRLLKKQFNSNVYTQEQNNRLMYFVSQQR